MADKAEQNLAKLRKTAMAMNFVKKSEGQWNHDDWIGFIESIKAKGYDPIDEDQVGLLLEEKKEAYWAKQG